MVATGGTGRGIERELFGRMHAWLSVAECCVYIIASYQVQQQYCSGGPRKRLVRWRDTDGVFQCLILKKCLPSARYTAGQTPLHHAAATAVAWSSAFAGVLTDPVMSCTPRSSCISARVLISPFAYSWPHPYAGSKDATARVFFVNDTGEDAAFVPTTLAGDKTPPARQTDCVVTVVVGVAVVVGTVVRPSCCCCCCFSCCPSCGSHEVGPRG